MQGFGGKTNAIQKTATNLADASETAVEMSKGETGYACIIKSRGLFYIEDSWAMIRVWEEHIAEYEKGELVIPKY